MIGLTAAEEFGRTGKRLLRGLKMPLISVVAMAVFQAVVRTEGRQQMSIGTEAGIRLATARCLNARGDELSSSSVAKRSL